MTKTSRSLRGIPLLFVLASFFVTFLVFPHSSIAQTPPAPDGSQDIQTMAEKPADGEAAETEIKKPEDTHFETSVTAMAEGESAISEAEKTEVEARAEDADAEEIRTMTSVEPEHPVLDTQEKIEAVRDEAKEIVDTAKNEAEAVNQEVLTDRKEMMESAAGQLPEGQQQEFQDHLDAFLGGKAAAKVSFDQAVDDARTARSDAEEAAKQAFQHALPDPELIQADVKAVADARKAYELAKKKNPAEADAKLAALEAAKQKLETDQQNAEDLRKQAIEARNAAFEAARKAFETARKAAYEAYSSQLKILRTAWQEYLKGLPKEPREKIAKIQKDSSDVISGNNRLLQRFTEQVHAAGSGPRQQIREAAETLHSSLKVLTAGKKDGSLTQAAFLEGTRQARETFTSAVKAAVETWHNHLAEVEPQRPVFNHYGHDRLL